MLTRIDGLPSHVLGLKATGEVTKSDIENVLIPGLDALVEAYGKINYLLVLETEVKNFTIGAWLQDAKAGITNFLKWNKIAIVTSEKGVEKFSDVFGVVVPGTSKGFSPDELEEAMAWVAA